MESKKETKKKEAKKAESEEEQLKGENSSEMSQKEEIKKLEGKEPGKLEYFSKNELIEKLETFTKEIETKKEEVDNVREELKKIEEERDSWKNKYTRLQAEFENAEKRWQKNRQNLRLEYTASVLKSLLPLYDSFKKALESKDENNKVLKGFFDQFMNIMKSYGAKPIEIKEGEPFDYNYHEALSSIEKEEVPENTILEIIQDGWKIDKEVIRYVKVIISKKPKPPEPEEIAEEDSKEKKETQEENDEELD